MRVIFRVDASHRIGTGHVMRCLTLAHALHGRGALCRFVSREHPGNLLELIRKQGFEAMALPGGDEVAQLPPDPDDKPLAHARWLGTDWRTDAEQTRVGIGGTAADWLIVDHYALDARWETTLRPHSRQIMAIDDLADRSHDCDLLLDQNLVADLRFRYENKIPASCGRMLGSNYALLQPHYAELHPRVPPREGPVRRVLVYFGGADADNVTGRTIAAFLALGRADIALDVVVNPSSPHAAVVRQLVAGHTQITLHESLPSLASLMVKADLAIGAGGATSWERCCLGLPSLVISLAENQIPIAAELDQQGLIRWLGHKDVVGEAILVQALNDVFHAGLAPEWSERCRQQVDGRGVDRVTSILMLNAQTKLKARLARLDDEALILGWANDPLVRQNAFSVDKIAPDTHRAWFRKRLRDLDDCRLYVMETKEAFPVGQVRFERSGDAWEIHYALDARVRGRGVGIAMLETALKALAATNPGCKVFGRVKPDNFPSQDIFSRLGFSEKVDGADLTYQFQTR